MERAVDGISGDGVGAAWGGSGTCCARGATSSYTRACHASSASGRQCFGPTPNACEQTVTSGCAAANLEGGVYERLPSVLSTIGCCNASSVFMMQAAMGLWKKESRASSTEPWGCERGDVSHSG